MSLWEKLRHTLQHQLVTSNSFNQSRSQNRLTCSALRGSRSHPLRWLSILREGSPGTFFFKFFVRAFTVFIWILGLLGIIRMIGMTRITIMISTQKKSSSSFLPRCFLYAMISRSLPLFESRRIESLSHLIHFFTYQ